MKAFDELHHSLTELKQIGVEQAADDESLMARVHELEIEFLGLRVTCHRGGEYHEDIVAIRMPPLRAKITELAFEMLGYYALPLESGGPGRNEPAIGPVYADKIRAARFDDEPADTLEERKTALARKLLQPGTTT